ncbi:MAG: hypothetical protein P8Y81_02055, partial [Ignavibacteriaceae bacterium]
LLCNSSEQALEKMRDIDAAGMEDRYVSGCLEPSRTNSVGIYNGSSSDCCDSGSVIYSFVSKIHYTGINRRCG